MSTKAIVASRNEGKIAEIREILTIPGLELITYRDLEEWPDIREEGESFYENALLKARALVEKFGVAAISDDSGLEVDALGGAPGIKSSRFAGDRANDMANNVKLLGELADLEFSDRTARFRCSAVYMDKDRRVISAEGTLEGHVGFEPRGRGGFGYDPLFIPSGYDKTLAELGSQVKNRISHRARAFRLLKSELEKVLSER
ncbi:MAG: RdgB/HAM1 family non-canonical purine NTP pyrophosphatase [Actinobacteria bacterium]|nr:RdgB/HAM1 family non-canonical purine NTP pyrophosphatase [Actinomycetota bacterium]